MFQLNRCLCIFELTEVNCTKKQVKEGERRLEFVKRRKSSAMDERRKRNPWRWICNVVRVDKTLLCGTVGIDKHDFTGTGLSEPAEQGQHVKKVQYNFINRPTFNRNWKTQNKTFQTFLTFIGN